MNKPESLCDRCDKYASCLLNYDGLACRRNRTTQPTNADRIRAKSDEELAAWIESIVYCRSCPFHGKQCDGEAFVSRASCKLHWLDWLKKEADNANPR